MIDNSVNKSIHCSVHSCAFNNSEQGYCKLDSITVGTHESNPTEKKCTDCESFKLSSCASGNCMS